MSALNGKTLFITGASRGIGREIALRAAEDGANIVVAAKTAEPHAKLPHTIYSVAEEIEQLGGKALAVQLDVRDDEAIRAAMRKCEETFGGLDILVNNASALWLVPTADTPMKRYDLIMSVNSRATFACSQAAVPLLRQAKNPHILNLSPPINLDSKWFKDHVAYTISKYGMSMCTLGMAAEFKEESIAVNSLWPRSIIATSAVEFNFPSETLGACRKPRIMADAAHAIFTKSSSVTSGNFFIDEDLLRAEGKTDFEHYAVNPNAPLATDLYIDD